MHGTNVKTIRSEAVRKNFHISEKTLIYSEQKNLLRYAAAGATKMLC